MKKVFYLCALSFLVCLQAQAQIPPTPVTPELPIQPTNEDPNQIYTIVQQEATFPNGQQGMVKFLGKNFRYPRNVIRLGITGKVYAKFVITKTGEITNVGILQGIPNCNECNEEVIRLIQMMPKWNPAKQNGKPVNVYFILPFVFAIPK